MGEGAVRRVAAAAFQPCPCARARTSEGHRYMLKVENLNAWYGASHVLQDMSLEVNAGEIVCLIGRNGAGKTTTLKSIMGLVPKTRGSVTFEGQELAGRPVHA